MAVIDVKLVSGYQADEDSLKRVSYLENTYVKSATQPLFGSSRSSAYM